MSKSTKNDVAWEKIFDKHDVIQKVMNFGHVTISASAINEFREARLMTKFDHRSQLPALFEKNKFSILPTSRGGYVIGEFETFHDFSKNAVETKKITFPSFLESLNFKDITSEATAINCAFVCKILHDFTGEENLLPTVSGRMSSSSFDFHINSMKGLFQVTVGNSQIEIDGGYEGDNSLNLIEAKNYISDDFLVRQLYYPYKLWQGKIKKKVRPIFLTYTNGTFHLREYSFTDSGHYNSLILLNESKYAIQEGAINVEMIQKVLDEAEVTPEPQIPFPQADSFIRVINLCELLFQKGFLSKEEITLNYDFDARQTDYYINAGKYLGLIQSEIVNNQKGCCLTVSGISFFNTSIVDRQLIFVKLILQHEVFNKVLINYFKFGGGLSKHDVVEIMKSCNLYNIVGDSTYYRRASTILGWINWILDLIEE